MQVKTHLDGRIEAPEWTARPRAAEKAKADLARMWDCLDADRDGALGHSELDTLLAHPFVRLNANGNVTLTGEERRAACGRAGY
jgi:hypothetical protein